MSSHSRSSRIEEQGDYRCECSCSQHAVVELNGCRVLEGVADVEIALVGGAGIAR